MGSLNGDLLGYFLARYCGVIGCGVINLDVAEILLNQVSKRSSVVLSKFVILVLQGECKHKF
ncbi:hypothetical protein [Campylobacter concisus]|uniref:Uncharacterized protein n=1 Tax=Campylobacter concisus TaxID=199 RepID=A0A7S9RHB5_9BACT|nr:hypothetical protein [Campylobacter concisus]QPH91725.1 hypothetical protein CVT01_04085 [Campylobacter concisus]